LLDGVGERGHLRVQIADLLAAVLVCLDPLPKGSLCARSLARVDRLGVPREDEAKMLNLTQEIFGTDDPEMRRASREPIDATIRDFFAYFGEITADRRKNPKDDVATVIANAQLDGKPIGDFEAMSYYIIIATAGHDTTSSSTAGGLLALMRNPGELAKLRANPPLLGPAVDEMLRCVTPV
jgi:cytochrome P450